MSIQYLLGCTTSFLRISEEGGQYILETINIRCMNGYRLGQAYNTLDQLARDMESINREIEVHFSSELVGNMIDSLTNQVVIAKRGYCYIVAPKI